MKKRLIILILSVIAISLSSCEKNNGCFERKNELVIQKCIDKIIEVTDRPHLQNCYLVSPYLDSLSLEPYSEIERQSLFKALGMSEKKFYKAQKKILEYSGNYIDDLADLSKCKTSDGIFRVNKVYKNLVHIRFTDYYEEVGLQDLKDKLEFNPNQMFEYVCVLKKDGEVEIVLETASFYD